MGRHFKSRSGLRVQGMAGDLQLQADAQELRVPQSEDFFEGLSALFMMKREPDFKGR